jgi:hypothetical protein
VDRLADLVDRAQVAVDDLAREATLVEDAKGGAV